MDLHRDSTDLLTEFASSGVRYLVVGGWAVGVHAEPRYTKALDLLIDGSSDNTERALQALEACGAPAGLIEEVQTMTEDELVFFGTPPARVDLLRQIPGVDFMEAWGHRKDVNWQGTTVHIIGIDALIASNLAAGRPKDLDDARSLEAVRRHRP